MPLNKNAFAPSLCIFCAFCAVLRFSSLLAGALRAPRLFFLRRALRPRRKKSFCRKGILQKYSFAKCLLQRSISFEESLFAKESFFKKVFLCGIMKNVLRTMLLRILCTFVAKVFAHFCASLPPFLRRFLFKIGSSQKEKYAYSCGFCSISVYSCVFFAFLAHFCALLRFSPPCRGRASRAPPFFVFFFAARALRAMQIPFCKKYFFAK